MEEQMGRRKLENPSCSWLNPTGTEVAEAGSTWEIWLESMGEEKVVSDILLLGRRRHLVINQITCKLERFLVAFSDEDSLH